MRGVNNPTQGVLKRYMSCVNYPTQGVPTTLPKVLREVYEGELPYPRGLGRYMKCVNHPTQGSCRGI